MPAALRRRREDLAGDQLHPIVRSEDPRLRHAVVLVASPPARRSSPLPAQEQADSDVTHGVVYDEHRGIERPYARLRGDALPTYVVVETFFEDVSHRLDRPTEIWNWFLRQLAISPGSGAEAALKDAVLEARISVLPSYAGESGSATARDREVSTPERVEHKRAQVHDLARIYAALLADLARHGYDLDKLDHYLESDVRVGTSVTIYPEPDSAVDLWALLLEEMRRFDHLLIEALATEGAPEVEGGQ